MIEKQYEGHLELKRKKGLTRLGIEKSASWQLDPRHLAFSLSRYKFVAKMLSGKKNVLEVGCGDGFAIPIVLQEVGSVHAVDIDPVFIEDIAERVEDTWPFTFAVHDILSGSLPNIYDGAYFLDVFEHIPMSHERILLKNIANSLISTGVCILGTPSLESQAYASSLSKQGHINCKSGPDLKKLMLDYFDNVFLFSMNDEIVHTGYYVMAHYLFVIGCGVKR